MSITRMGATKQYSDNWENVFGGGKGRSSSKAAAAKPAKQSAKKKTAKTATNAASGKKAKSRGRKKVR